MSQYETVLVVHCLLSNACGVAEEISRGPWIKTLLKKKKTIIEDHFYKICCIKHLYLVKNYDY